MSDRNEEAWLKDVARELRQPARLDETFDQRVMAAVRATRRERAPARAWNGWTEKRWSITLTPLRALAVAASLAAVAVGSGWIFAHKLPQQIAPAAVAATKPGMHAVQFVMVAPKAGVVTLVGDFNNWNASATPMQRESTSGVWSVTVPLSAGRYQYAFVIDGHEWRADPTAPAAPVDDFGTPNSIVAVGDRVS